MNTVIDTTLPAALRSAARRYDSAPALVATTVGGEVRRWSFAGLWDDAAAAARGLLELFAPGERLAIWAPNVAECYLAQLACGLAGLTVVPVPTGLTPGELRGILSRARAAGIALVSGYRGVDMAASVESVAPELPDLREMLDLAAWSTLASSARASAELPEVKPADPIQIQFSSGTTGAPKGVVLQHNGVMNASRLLAEGAAIGREDRWLNFMPLSYIAGSAIAAPGALQVGAAQVLCDFDPAAVLAVAERESVSVTVCGPTMATMMADQPDAVRHLRSLRSIGLGGSVSPLKVSRRLESELGATVWVLYGLTEACGIVTQTHPWDPDEARLGTAGTAQAGAEVAVFDLAMDRPAPEGVDGEVRIRGYQVMLGYLDDPQATAQAVDNDGWLHTGDLGRLDESGRLRIVGRIKDIVNRGGRKLYPAEIEQALSSHPGVAAVAVAPLPDPHWGEIAAAFVVSRGDRAPAVPSLVAWCRRQLAPYKTPERWIFVDELPITRSGKVQKQRLIDAYRKGAPN